MYYIFMLTTTNNGATDMNLIDITDATDAELDALFDDAVAFAAMREIADAFPAGGADLPTTLADFRAEKAARAAADAARRASEPTFDLIALFRAAGAAV